MVLRLRSLQEKKGICDKESSTEESSKQSIPDPLLTTRPPVSHRHLGHDTCVFSAACSLADYVGFKDLISVLKDATAMSLTHPNRMLFLKDTVNSHANFSADWIDIYSVDILTDHIACGVFQLRSECGNVEHAVGISGTWIFDASCSAALPLNKESLDSCVSGLYDGVESGLLITSP